MHGRPDPYREQEAEDRRALTGQDDPWDWRIAHDERIDAQDRAADKAPARYAHLAYTERPSDRERREHFDERRATTRLYPRRSDSQVTGLGRKAA